MPRQPQRAPKLSSSRTKRQRKGPSKAQEQAAAVRAAQTHPNVFAASQAATVGDERSAAPTVAVTMVDAPSEVIPRRRSGVRPVASQGRARPGRSATTIRKLSHEQEFAFIKADLRRLLITAGSLAAVMIVLLFVIEQ